MHSMLIETTTQFMALPHEAEYRPGEEQETLRTFNTRQGGSGRVATNERPKVVVDVREFRSALPSMLHKESFEVVPTTLAVGDYILTPEMCVERKSLPDLIQSFNSGRLCVSHLHTYETKGRVLMRCAGFRNASR